MKTLLGVFKNKSVCGGMNKIVPGSACLHLSSGPAAPRRRKEKRPKWPLCKRVPSTHGSNSHSWTILRKRARIRLKVRHPGFKLAVNLLWLRRGPRLRGTAALDLHKCWIEVGPDKHRIKGEVFSLSLSLPLPLFPPLSLTLPPLVISEGTSGTLQKLQLCNAIQMKSLLLVEL